MATVNVEVFLQDIFSHISRNVSHARKYDVSGKMNLNRAKRIKDTLNPMAADLLYSRLYLICSLLSWSKM